MCPAPGPSGGERVFRRPKVASSLMLRTHRFCTNDKFILKKGARPFAFKWPLQLELHQDVRSGVSGADSVRPGALRPARRRGGLCGGGFSPVDWESLTEPRSRKSGIALHSVPLALLPLCVVPLTRHSSDTRQVTCHNPPPLLRACYAPGPLACAWPAGEAEGTASACRALRLAAGRLRKLVCARSIKYFTRLFTQSTGSRRFSHPRPTTQSGLSR